MKLFRFVSLACAIAATVGLTACNKAGETPASTSTPSSTMPPASAASR